MKHLHNRGLASGRGEYRAHGKCEVRIRCTNIIEFHQLQFIPIARILRLSLNTLLVCHHA